MESNIKLPKRSKCYGIGKEIGGAIYVHRSYEHLLGQRVSKAKQHIPSDFDYVVVKFTEATENVSFIECPDFDSADEPTLGLVLTVKVNGQVTRREPPEDPYIYHHKWLFVADDYENFDVEESKKRSCRWMKLPKIDRSRIGRKSYWTSEVIPKIEKNDNSE